MNYEQLVDVWQSQPEQALTMDEDQVLQAVRAEHRREERRLLWINLQEVIPAVALFVFFGLCGLTMESGKWAFFSAALLCLGIGVFLVGSTIRQRVRESAFGDTVKEQLGRAILQVKHREWLYRNILWWYLLPGALGWGMIVYEKMFKDGISAFEAGYVAVALAFFAWVYRANRRIAVKRYSPGRAQLEELLRAIDSSDESGSAC